MPANTPGGWPYVLPADHPLEYPAQSQQLAAKLDARAARHIGHALKTANQTGIGATPTDVTGLTATATVPAGHLIRITARVQVVQNGAVAHVYLRLQEGSTVIGLDAQIIPTVGGNAVITASTLLVNPSAGPHTYKALLSTSAGTVDVTASAGAPCYFLVEDLGATPPA